MGVLQLTRDKKRSLKIGVFSKKKKNVQGGHNFGHNLSNLIRVSEGTETKKNGVKLFCGFWWLFGFQPSLGTKKDVEVKIKSLRAMV